MTPEITADAVFQDVPSFTVPREGSYYILGPTSAFIIKNLLRLRHYTKQGCKHSKSI